MGVYEEAEALHFPVIPVNDKTDYAPRKQPSPLKKHKEFIIVIVAQLLVIIGLIVALITVSTGYSPSCDVNNTESEKNQKNASRSLAGKITEPRKQTYAPCDDDWIWYRGKCYYFSKRLDTWSNSQRFCISNNASLVHINNKEELDFLLRCKGTDNHWIGLRRTDDNTAWVWTNGALHDESLFSIKRELPEDIEYVYLNSKDVRSQEEASLTCICEKTPREVH